MVFKPEGDIAKILDKINKEYAKLEIGSYPFYKPPKIGTNVVLEAETKFIDLCIKVYWLIK